MKIQNLGSISTKFGRIAQETAESAVTAGIKTVQAAAKNLCPVDHGELRDSIYTDIRQEGAKTIGTCYTNKAYAVFVEMGTGPKGAANHDGISPDVAPVYHVGPWWIHEDQIDKEVAEKSHWFYIDTPEGRFYRCTGQRAQPYMYPALNDNREEIKDVMSNIIANQIEEKDD